MDSSISGLMTNRLVHTKSYYLLLIQIFIYIFVCKITYSLNIPKIKKSIERTINTSLQM